jgi:carbon monoxide dehydrogenase subunit G
MTLTASATVEVRASPQQVLEFVLDLERYRQADHKITRVSSVTGPDAHGEGSVKLWGTLPGMPAAPDRQNFTLEKWSRLTFVGAPRQPGRLVFDFVGTFACVPVADGVTQVTHGYEFNFRAPFRWLERRMAEPLQAEIDAEVDRLGHLLNGSGGE